MSRTVLVTGAAGFIGAPLVRELLARELHVVALDDFSVGARERLDSRADALELDVRDAEGVHSALAGIRPWGVVHLAALHFIPWCEADPARTRAINVAGTRHLLDAVPQAERIVLASTGDVYAPCERPRRETDPTEAGGVYGASKLEAEALVRPRGGALVARLFNVYGPGETNPHVVPEILAQLRRGDRLRLGNTSARRDWLFLDDAVAALAGLLLDVTQDATVNVGTGTATSVADVVELLRGITGRPLEVIVEPERLRASDRPVLAAETSLLRELLPRLELTALDDGLRRTLRAEGLL